MQPQVHKKSILHPKAEQVRGMTSEALNRMRKFDAYLEVLEAYPGELSLDIMAILSVHLICVQRAKPSMANTAAEMAALACRFRETVEGAKAFHNWVASNFVLVSNPKAVACRRWLSTNFEKRWSHPGLMVNPVT
jgi:hypothetical protein